MIMKPESGVGKRFLVLSPFEEWMNEGNTPFRQLALVCKRLGNTGKRLEERRIVSDFLKTLNEREVGPAVLLLVGRIFPETESKALNVGWKTMQKAFSGGKQATLLQKPLTILEVRDSFEKIASTSGKDSMRRKLDVIRGLLGRADALEKDALLRMFFGEMQHGVSDGVMLEAIADASRSNPDLVRRAHMLSGDLGMVAEVALKEGTTGLRKFGIVLFNPIKPMLAEMADSIEEVVKEHRQGTAFEFKYDGARIQIHKKGEDVRIFTRRLSDVTSSLPEVVELAQQLSLMEAVVEGEVIAVDAEERPLPFQELMRRLRRVHEIEKLRERMPLRLYLFDILYADGRQLIDEAYRKRWKILSNHCPEELLARRMILGDVTRVKEFLSESLSEGHEGLMAKALESYYTPGHRGKKWLKIKPADYLDVAIIAADWGYGRRSGWLSNYHLAVLDESTGGFQMIGKTFKGLTDEQFEWMTGRLQELKTRETRHTVYVRPEIVVEVAYNEIQKSSQYESGYALRFARIKKIREDKGPMDIDTLERLINLYEKQFERKGRL